MKRYKDCTLVCNAGQKAMDLLGIIEQISIQKGYKVERYTSWRNHDSLAIYTQEKSLPKSRLILSLSSELNSVNIVNIIPTKESGTSQIGYIEYNKLLNIYRDDVFAEIKKQYGNTIEENTEDYGIEDIIPSSYKFLDLWLSMYPLSEHPLDTNRWYDFVIALHRSGERLSLSDFEKYIEETYNWDKDDIVKFSLRLETHLELLEYFDNNKQTI